MTINTIVVKGRGIRKEALAAGTITPGHLVKRDSAGKYVVHATAGGKAALAFAVENELAGDEISVNYASGGTCFVEYVQSGAEINALLAANAAAVVKGDLLESAGDGTLRKLDVTSTVFADLTGTLTGTANGSLADIAATAAATAGGATPTAAQVDTGIALAVSTIVSGTNEQLKELQTKLNAILPQAVGNPLAVALEAVDNSAVAAVARILVEVL